MSALSLMRDFWKQKAILQQQCTEADDITNSRGLDDNHLECYYMQKQELLTKTTEEMRANNHGFAALVLYCLETIKETAISLTSRSAHQALRRVHELSHSN